MPVFLLKIIFVTLSTISFFVTRLIFSTTAYLLVLLIQVCKIPGESAKGLLEQFSESFKGVVQYFLGLIVAAIAHTIATTFDLLKEGIVGSVSVLSSAIMGLVEQTRASFEEMLKDLPDLLQEFREMISTIVTDLVNNYKAALGYVKESFA